MPTTKRAYALWRRHLQRLRDGDDLPQHHFRQQRRYFGGGIYNNYGTVTISQSTISSNGAGYDGGGLYNNGTVTVENSSSITGNKVSYFGAGHIQSRPALPGWHQHDRRSRWQLRHWIEPCAKYPLLVVHRPSARALLEHELFGLHAAKFNRPRLDELDGLRQPNRLGRCLRRHQFDVCRRAILPAQAMKHEEPVKRYDFSRMGKSGQGRNSVCAPARRFFTNL